jgi:hypothetical protein
MKTIVVNQGYTVTCVSWENDGDNYNTNSMVVQDIEEARALRDLCNMSSTGKNHRGGLGNCQELEDFKPKIVDFMKSNPVLGTYKSDEKSFDLFGELNYELLGSSEWYGSRVCESVEITYSPEDVYAEIIE